jgi:hypothetical protein
LKARSLVRLDALDAAQRPEDMTIPGFDFYAPTVHRITAGETARFFAFSGQLCIDDEFLLYLK